MALHLVHQWRTVRDDGYWLYQECIGCHERRSQLKNKLLQGQPANKVWLEGGELPTPIGEDEPEKGSQPVTRHAAELDPHKREMMEHMRQYVVIGGVLYVFTFITVMVAYFQLPTVPAIVLALTIATIKASLVALFFMHLLDEKKLIYATLLLTGAFFVLCMTLPSSTTFEGVGTPMFQDRAEKAMHVSHEHKGHEATEAGASLATDTAAFAGAKFPVTATVVFKGAPPAPKKIDVNADAFCAKTPHNEEDVMVSNGRLQNVVVKVVNAPKTPAPSTPVVIAQDTCMYRPRVQLAVAGQAIAIKSMDDTTHNVHTYKGDDSVFNRAESKGQSIDKTTADFKTEDGAILFKCDIHPWMTGWIFVSPHSYAGVSAADGTVKLQLPAGKFLVEAWHEKLGKKTAEITVEAGKPAELTFEYP